MSSMGHSLVSSRLSSSPANRVVTEQVVTEQASHVMALLGRTGSAAAFVDTTSADALPLTHLAPDSSAGVLAGRGIRLGHSGQMCDSVPVVAASPGRSITRSCRTCGGCRDRVKGVRRVYKPWSAGPVRAPDRPLDRPVWVDLDQLYGTPDESIAGFDDDPLPGGLLQATGRVPGLLKRWKRAVDGRWFGVCTWTVCDTYGAVAVRHEGGLVPAAALSPREMEPRR
jgi:hypothetical protein